MPDRRPPPTTMELPIYFGEGYGYLTLLHGRLYLVLRHQPVQDIESLEG